MKLVLLLSVLATLMVASHASPAEIQPIDCPLYKCAVPLCQVDLVQNYDKNGCQTCPTCPELPCPVPGCQPPPCDNSIPGFFTLKDGTRCPGCPECPKLEDPLTGKKCRKLDMCPDTFCTQAICPDAQPRCEARGDSFCRVCDDCPGPIGGGETCDTFQCPSPPYVCKRFSPIQLNNKLCGDCDVCIDDLRSCPAILCAAPTKPCRNSVQYPTKNAGIVCLGCPVCLDDCPHRICPRCRPIDNWDQPLDSSGCPVGCPPCGPALPKCPRWNRQLCRHYKPVTIDRKRCMGCSYNRRGGRSHH